LISFSPGKKESSKVDDGWVMVFMPKPYPTFATILSPGQGELYGMMDSATSPFGSEQNDRLGVHA